MSVLAQLTSLCTVVILSRKCSETTKDRKAPLRQFEILRRLRGSG
jgi:hypothetical protein